MTVENEDSSETSLHMYQAKQLRIPEDSHPYHCGKNSPVSDDVTVMYRIWYRVLILPRNLNFTFLRTLYARDETNDCPPDTHQTALKINGGGAV
jgi:hypothetical protein